MKRSRSALYGLITLTSVLALTHQAQAQSSPSLPQANEPQASTTAQGDIEPATSNPTDTARADDVAAGDIIVTATRRAETLSRVPIAVSAVAGRQLALSGATDIRGLQQLAPSLTVNTTSSETTATARIRNIGTAGANFGLESSVATFVDGVYRARSGIALGELGDVERVEVLRGPQGTLFGRNASAGLINVISQGPETTFGGHAQIDLGNYAERRFDAMLTGPITSDDTLAFRVQGIYEERDGLFRDVISGRSVNNRDRYFVRGQLSYEPTDRLSFRIIGDYTHRDEECCLANFRPARSVTASGGTIVTGPSSVATLERALGAVINDDPSRRVGSITPGQSFNSPVRDWGISGQADWDLGGAKLTSITAWRDYRNAQALDADFSNLDLLQRTRNFNALRNFSQEVRLQGEAFAGRLDWLIGGYFASEVARSEDNLTVGSQYGVFQACQIAGVAAGALGVNPSALVSPTSAGCLNPAVRPLAAGFLGAAATPLLAGLDRLSTFRNVGINDRFRQNGSNFAVFTHNNIKLGDRLTLTAGLRWTHDRKRLNADLAGPAGICGAQQATLGRLTAAGLPTTVQSLAGGLLAVSCPNGIGDTALNGSYGDSFSDSEFTGTAVLSYRPIDALLTYASYSRGYKAGGYNLDRAGLSTLTPSAQRAASLAFAPEFVDSYEVGAKLSVSGFKLNVAAFWEELKGLQYSIFNGTNFLVVNVDGCKGALTPVTGVLPSLGRCDGERRSGVYSRGVEIEGNLIPARDFSLQAGFTLADTRFRDRIAGTGGAPLPNGLALLPGSRLAYAPLYTVSTGATFTPELARGLKGLVHVDARLQSDFNTGSDLFVEKMQDSFVLLNARVGISSADKGWAIEAWARNLLNTDYAAVVANAPTQGQGTASFVQRGYATSATGLFTNLLGDPRTYGVTMRVAF